MTQPDSIDDTLDRALARLARADLPPWAAATLLKVASK